MSSESQIIDKKGGIEWRLLVNWMQHNGFNEPCCELHPNKSCAHEIIFKFLCVAKNNNTFYFAIHLIPFLIFKLKTLKSQSKTQILTAILKLIKRYLGSILFMSSFVAGIRAILCFRGSTGSIAILPWFPICCLFSSFGIFLQEGSRRKEIALYAFVRAIPTAYKLFQRRGFIKIPQIQLLVFVSLFGMFSLCYHKFQKNLTYASVFQKIWGSH